MTVSASGDEVRVRMRPPSPLAALADRLEVQGAAAVTGS